jgi:hypothetical protein
MCDPPEPEPSLPQPIAIDHVADLRATLDGFAATDTARALTPEQRQCLEAEGSRVVKNLVGWDDIRIARGLCLTLGEVGALKDLPAGRGGGQCYLYRIYHVF